MVFSNIGYLLLFIPLIGYVIWYILRGYKLTPSLKVSTISPYIQGNKSYKNYIIHLPFALRVFTIAMVILVLARPQSTNRWQNTEVEGIDIMLAMDVSTSMLAMDLKPNRIEAAKQVAAEFINALNRLCIDGYTIADGSKFCNVAIHNQMRSSSLCMM